MFLNDLLKEAQLLIQLKLTVLSTEGVEFSKAFEEFCTVMGGSQKDLTSFLPFKFVGITFTYFLTLVA